MWNISVETYFSAAHQLKGYPGDCSDIHGHNFRVKATVEAAKIESLGFGIDFKKLKKLINKVVKKLDHKNLNKLPQFKKDNPTAENIARFIYQDLSCQLKKNIKLKQVQVWESTANSVTYYESE